MIKRVDSTICGRYYDPKIGRFISEDTYKGAVDNPLSLNRYTYTHNNPLRFVDSSGHAVEAGTGGIGGFTSRVEEYLHWGRVAARKAYEEEIEQEDAVRKYVPTQYQEEVLPTAIVTFNNTVGMNHGDAPDLGLAAPATGALAGTLKNTSKGMPPIVQSRINISNDGWKHVVDRHFSNKNASKFTISQDELRSLLFSKDIVKSSVVRSIDSADGVRYARVVTLESQLDLINLMISSLLLQ